MPEPRRQVDPYLFEDLDVERFVESGVTEDSVQDRIAEYDIESLPPLAPREIHRSPREAENLRIAEYMREHGWIYSSRDVMEQEAKDGRVPGPETHVAYMRVRKSGLRDVDDTSDASWQFFEKNFNVRQPLPDSIEDVVPPDIGAEAELLDIYQVLPVPSDVYDYALYQREQLQRDQYAYLDQIKKKLQRPDITGKEVHELLIARAEQQAKYAARIAAHTNTLSENMTEHPLQKLIHGASGWVPDPSESPHLKVPADFNQIIHRRDFKGRVLLLRSELQKNVARDNRAHTRQIDIQADRTTKDLPFFMSGESGDDMPIQLNSERETLSIHQEPGDSDDSDDAVFTSAKSIPPAGSMPAPGEDLEAFAHDRTMLSVPPPQAEPPPAEAAL